MKKILLLTMIFILIVTFTGCNNSEKENVIKYKIIDVSVARYSTAFIILDETKNRITTFIIEDSEDFYCDFTITKKEDFIGKYLYKKESMFIQDTIIKSQ